MNGLVFASIGLTTLALLGGHAWSGSSQPVVLLLIALFGLIWALGYHRAWSGIDPLGLVLSVAWAAYGLGQGGLPFLLLIGAVGGLVSWDLGRFSRRLSEQERIESETQFKQQHLKRLLTVTGIGLLMGGLALTLQFQLTFGWAVVLGLLTVISLSWVVGSLRRER